jgi:serine/threonine protein kinase
MLVTCERRISLGRLLNGESGYFQSYQGWDETVDRAVFVKLARATDDPLKLAIVQAHVRQWRALGRETIPFVPAILDLGQFEGRWFLSTEWIDCPTLGAFFAQKLELAEADDVLVGVLDRCLSVLAGFHAAGFIHGDISPGNILADPRISPTRAYLIDSAPPLDLPDPNDPTRRLIFGKRPYLAPEVLVGRALTIRSDLFALGKVFEEFSSVIGARSPRVISRLLAEKPQDRPATADEASALLHEERPSPAFASARRPVRMGFEETPQPAMSFRDDETTIVGVPRSNHWDEVSRALSVRLPPTALASVPAAASGATAIESVPAPDALSADPTQATFSVMAPPLIEAGRHFVVEVWAARSADRDAMMIEAVRPGRMVERGWRSHVEIDCDTVITVGLKIPDFEVEEPIETLGWNGTIRNVGFIVKAPSRLSPGIYPGSVKLMMGQMPFASILFDLEVSGLPSNDVPPRELSTEFQRIRRAFASYASGDRAEVLRRVQGIQAAGTSVFLDIIALRSGDAWEAALYREIDASDRFFLFWSRNAAESPWVNREWRFALDRRGLDFIDPVPLVDPRQVPPPEELKSKHFNDLVLGFIALEEMMKDSAGRRPS